MKLQQLLTEAEVLFDARPVVTSGGRKSRAGRKQNAKAELVASAVSKVALSNPRTEAEAVDSVLLLLPIWQQLLIYFFRSQLQSLLIEVAKWVFRRLNEQWENKQHP